MQTEALVFSAAHTCEIASYDRPEAIGRGEMLRRNRRVCEMVQRAGTTGATVHRADVADA